MNKLCCLLILFLSSILIDSGFATTEKKAKKETREYEVETNANGTITRKLIKIIKYSIDGNVISSTEVCNDSICCEHNKTFRLHMSKNEYRYENHKLVLRVFRRCDSLPCYKAFYEYKYDSKNRLIEKKEITYDFETDSEKYENGKWVVANRGDSTLDEISTSKYEYNEFDSIQEEHINIQGEYRENKEISWTQTYKYDKNKNKISQEWLTYESLKVKSQWFYDEKNRVVKYIFNPHGEDEITEFSYNSKGNLSSKRLQISERGSIKNYEYNENNLLSVETEEVKNMGKSITKYFYNANKDLIREEKSWDKGPFGITEYEYEYY